VTSDEREASDSKRLQAWRSMEQSGARAVTFERDGLVGTAQTGDDIGFLLFVEGAYQGEETGRWLSSLWRTTFSI
jgi:hypothetical protein